MKDDYPTQAESVYEGKIEMTARASGFAAWGRGEPYSSCKHPIDSRARVDWHKGWLLANEGKKLHES